MRFKRTTGKRTCKSLWVVCAAVVMTPVASWAAILVEEGLPNNPSYGFPTIPAPTSGDIGESATIAVVEGGVDAGSGPVSQLNDGLAQTSGAAPFNQHFWFNEGTVGKVQMTWASPISIAEVNTYTWHADNGQFNGRARQVYRLYGSSEAAPGVTDGDLAGVDWTFLGEVDTDDLFGGAGRPQQLAVNFSDAGGLGTFKHLLWRIEPPGSLGTFYGEFDVILVPEPATMFLFGIGTCIVLLRRRG